MLKVYGHLHFMVAVVQSFDWICNGAQEYILMTTSHSQQRRGNVTHARLLEINNFA